jgi:mRNA interferase RelE/StbE
MWSAPLAWRIEFEDTALKELAKLDKQVARRILTFLRERVAVLDDPRSVGEALKGSRLGEFWKYRVGDYRIITNIEDGVMRILVLKVGNRREVYRG